MANPKEKKAALPDKPEKAPVTAPVDKPPEENPLVPASGPPCAQLTLNVLGATPEQVEMLRRTLQTQLDKEYQRYHRFPSRRPW